jgi:hypothetical protein
VDIGHQLVRQVDDLRRGGDELGHDSKRQRELSGGERVEKELLMVPITRLF